MPKQSMSFLVGDNPFHGISHLSQARVRARSNDKGHGSVEYFAQLVKLALENGADGFMFSVDDTTLSILQTLSNETKIDNVQLHAIVPYAYEYVRRATNAGGVSGLARQLAKEMVFSSNAKILALNAGGLLGFNPSALLKTYVSYEISRIKSVTKTVSCLKSVMLHEIITDMALALNLEDLFKSYIRFMKKSSIKAGFETRNFTYLVNKFGEWNIDFKDVTLTTSFNKVGFQMEPSKAECEAALKCARDAEVIAMSILASGYLRPADAVEYVESLQDLSGVVVGVSKERHATETFRLLKNELNRCNRV
ncbi:MAG: hypothetical protein ACBZ72_05210 [Candidatus Bathyarchaeia archaeon]|jgi:hypothetical protein